MESELLRTGSISSQTPYIQHILEGVLAGQTTARQDTEGAIARIPGLARSSIGARILGDQSRQFGLDRNNALMNALAPFLKSAINSGSLVPGGGESGLGQQANIQAQLAQAAASANASNTQAIGAGVGALAALAVAACWIAGAIYGDGSREQGIIRWWMFTQWDGVLSKPVCWIYQRYGERAAQYRIVVWACKPFFAWALRQADCAWERAVLVAVAHNLGRL